MMRSVRLRLTLWNAGVFVLITSALCAGIFILARARLLAGLDRQLERDLASLEKTALYEPQDLHEAEHGLALFQVMDGGKPVHQTAGWSSIGPTHRVLTRDVSAPGHSYRISVAVDAASTDYAIRSLGFILLAAVPCAALLAIVGGYFLAGRMLAPVGAMATKASEITAERLSERLPVADPRDEFGRLAAVINDTLARLQNSFEQLRRFTADASHELRTPLTAIRSVGEVALQKEHDPASYRDAIGSMLEEVDRLARLVDSLLVLTRADAGVIKPAAERVDLGAMARSVADCLRVLAEEKGQTLAVDDSPSVSANADPTLVRQALTNLVDNAIKYTPSRGSVRIAVRQNDGHCAIEVSDTGPGIPAAHRDRLFERFYRVDGARSRDSGGVGLGLAISKWAVEANKGRIEVESEEGRGSLFRIVLPRSDRE